MLAYTIYCHFEAFLYVIIMIEDNNRLKYVCSNGNGIILQNEDLDHHNIEIFPNPTSDILNIKLEKIASSKLAIFDALGNRVLEKNNLAEKEFQLSTANFSEGIYFLKIEIEGKIMIKKFIKM